MGGASKKCVVRGVIRHTILKEANPVRLLSDIDDMCLVRQPVQQLAGVSLDDVFSGLKRGTDGRARLSVEGRSEKLTVEFGPHFKVAVVYSPKGRGFICFEPMSGPTNAFNLAHEGKYGELQLVPAGGTWSESYWIRPSGF